MYVWNRGQTLAIAALLKAARPGIILFAGGAEATADAAGVLADPAMDFVLPGRARSSSSRPCGASSRGTHPGPSPGGRGHGR